MADAYVGEIRLVGFNFAPSGWAFCNGQLLPISQNEVLYNLIGTTYGGDGQSTFGLPNLQSRVPVHQGTGQSTYIMGQTGGTTQVTLNSSQLPSHTHPVACQTSTSTTASPANAIFGTTQAAAYATPGATAVLGSLVSSSGGNQPHDNMQPFLAMNYIISLYGVYPSQN